jgi:hypothetical protein
MLPAGISFVIIAPAATTELSPIIGSTIFVPSAVTTFLQIIGSPAFSHSQLVLLHFIFEPIVTF